MMTRATGRPTASQRVRPTRVLSRAPAPQGIRILVAQGHRLLREGLLALLAPEPDVQVIAEASDGAQAVQLYRRHRPDVALIDSRLDHLDGAEVVRQLRREFPLGRFIVLAGSEPAHTIYRLFEAGMEGYVVKDSSPAELLEAIRTVHGGSKWIPTAIAQQGLDWAMTPKLTARELELLTFVVRGLSNAEIARELDLSEHTVKNHLVHVFSKLGVTARTQAAVEALQRGLVKMAPGQTPRQPGSRD